MLTPTTVTHNNAVIIPPTAPDAPLQTGVLAEGAIVPEAISYRGPHPSHENPAPQRPQARLSGRWLWGGQLYWHFGHFLTESATRLWAYAIHGPFDGVVFAPKRAHAGTDMPVWTQEFFRAAGMGNNIRVVTAPTEIETLVVAEQGFGLGDLSIGSREFRRFLQDDFAKDIAPDGPERLYLSRSEFGPKKGGLLGEPVLEDYLSGEGYEIFHPQKHPLPVQIARLKAAHRIAGPDGSAFHLAGFVARRDVQTALIMRRNSSVAQHIIRQFNSLLGVRVNAVNAIRNDWTVGGVRPDASSYGELDFADLSCQMQSLGMIEQSGWSDPGKGIIRKRIRQLSRKRGATLVPVPASERVTFRFRS